VLALAEASELAIEAGFELGELYQSLAEQRWRVMRRIAWSVLGQVDNAPSALLAHALLDADELQRADPSPEFRTAVSSHFGSLEAEPRERFERMVEDGPPPEDIERWRNWTLEQDGEDRSDEFVKVWKLRRFALIREALHGERLTQYEHLRADLGDREFAPREGLRFFSRETSPRTLTELQELPDPELITYLAEWVPEGGWGSPTVDGLAREVRALVAAEPERLSGIADQFGELDPNYIAALLDGLRRKVGEQASITWSPVLALSVRGLQRSAAVSPDELTETASSWRAARQEIAMLLSEGFEGDSVPMQERGRVFDVLRELLRDADPTLSREEREAPDQFDPSTLSLNSIRGQAFHAAMRYGLWIRRALDRTVETNEVRTFDDMPELREVLEERLSADVDPSMTIRSAFGQWFPWLVLLDADWASAHVDDVFPRPDHDRDRWWAAWGTYICLNPVYDNVFAVLELRYRIAISLMGGADVPFKWFGSWESVHQHLVDHLMVLFWRDALPQALLEEFFATAPVDLRKHALESLGRGLGEVADDVDRETAERVRNLFEARLGAVQEAASEERQELDPFGWWLETPALDGRWKLENLLALLQGGSTPEPDFKIYEFLSTAVGEEPEHAMRVLRVLIDASHDLWSLSGNRESIEQALTTALASDDPEARRLAFEIANRLGARGYRNFRSIVQGAARPNGA
jgi:hypothetical protein